MNWRALARSTGLISLWVLGSTGCASPLQGGTTWRDAPGIEREPYGYGFSDADYNASGRYNGGGP